ncbi:circularly permuted type 2 ATP-grasp protein [bacterium]|nr:circularly permuted type 2 ATP-grasp protein [bacterium]MBU1994308.1 circularly permuted type 2 ATP-grasp protein [bacterium]
MQIFDGYFSESLFDEVFDRNNDVRDCWKDVLKDIENSGLDALKKKQADIDWHLEDNGVTYNIYDNHDGQISRSWSLDPIPFVIAGEEWESIKKGLQQRAKLFNLILKDLYSEQKLIKENIVPAEVIFGHKGFATEVFDFGNKKNFNLYFYATDIARGPDGKMWVVNDRTQAPSGLGYAIENRLTMNSISQELYPNIVTKKLSSFIEEFKDVLNQLTDGDISTAALLTPGPHNETYFEHAYLSSFLEINMVQGEDLLSKNGSIWLKSLSGLKKINTLLRRVDDRFCDPLELKNDSKLGVAGLVESMRQNNLNMINPIGSAILENIGLNPFMKKISQYFLKEELILPQIATWWCGQKKELDYVLANLNKLIIKKIDRTEKIQVYFGRKLSQEELDNLRVLLLQSPNKYVAQEEIEFSTAPYYFNDKIEPRNAVIRAFCLKKDDEYTVMNGGLVRVSSIKDSLLVSSQKGGTSKDLWILGEDPKNNNPINFFKNTQFIETSIDKIPTPKAENLFWLGRYIARSITTTRLILHIIKKITNFYRYEVATSKESQEILQNALTHMTMTYPGFMDTKNQKTLDRFPMREIASIIKNTTRSGSLAFTISMLSVANINLKDLLAFESWKLFEKMQKEWNEFINRKGDSTLVISSELDKFLIYLMAYKELVKESIFKEQGLILYDIGYKIEDSLLLISKARSILCLKLDKSIGHDVLEGMLNSMESLNAYRAHYKSSLTLENVVDFLILNTQFPKSLKYMTDELLKEFKLLPKAKNYLTTYEEPIVEALSLLKSINLQNDLQIKEEEGIYTELDKVLSNLADLYLECSNEFSNTYFSHYDE